MLRYSYRVELKRAECDLSSLLLDQARGPSRAASEAIERKKKEIEWYRERIASGNDPGAHVL